MIVTWNMNNDKARIFHKTEYTLQTERYIMLVLTSVIIII